MIFQIVSLLLDIACGLFTGACLLRLYMQMQRIPFANPVGQLVFVLTDWLVIPLRKVLPSAGRWDLSCLIGAFLGQLVQYLILSLFVGASAAFAFAPLLAVFGVVRVAISGMMGLVLINAILSWVQSRSPITSVLAFQVGGRSSTRCANRLPMLAAAPPKSMRLRLRTSTKTSVPSRERMTRSISPPPRPGVR